MYDDEHIIGELERGDKVGVMGFGPHGPLTEQKHTVQ